MMKPNSAKKTDTNNQQRSLQKSTENSKRKQQRLSGIFLYPSRLVMRCALSILLLPWLMALNQCFRASEGNKPTAPPYPEKAPLNQCDPPPPYDSTFELMQQQQQYDLLELTQHQDYDPNTLTKKEAKNKAKECLKIAGGAIEKCKTAINDIQYHHALVQSLNQVIPPLSAASGLSSLRTVLNFRWCAKLKDALVIIVEQLEANKNKRLNLCGIYRYNLALASNKLDEAKKCIEGAIKKGSKRKALLLSQESAQCDSQILGLKCESNAMPIMNEEKNIIKQERKEKMEAKLEEKLPDFVTQSTNINVNQTPQNN